MINDFRRTLYLLPSSKFLKLYGYGKQRDRDVRVYTALHSVQVRTHTVEVRMGPIVKKN